MASQQQVPSNSADVDSNAPGYPSVALTSSEEANADLDHILSAALDELEDEELGGGGGGVSATTQKVETKGKVDLSDVAADNARDRVDRNMEEENKKRGQESMDKLLKDLRDPAYGHVLQDALKSLSGTKEGVNTIEDYLGDKFKEAKRKDSTMGDRTVNKLLDDFGKAGEFFIVLFCFALISFFCFLYYYIYIYI